LEPDDLVLAIDSALEEFDTIQQGGVAVVAVDLAHGGFKKIFCIKFKGCGVGGNVEALLVVPKHLLVLGLSASTFVLSDGETYAAQNAVELVTSQVGNELSGHFCLRLRGHTTRRIPFNSAIDEMKERLEEIPNIGQVDVQMSGPSKDMAYEWVIMFVSNPGYLPPSLQIVDVLEVINELYTLIPLDNSPLITVQTIRNGSQMLEGQFWLTYNDGKATATTQPLQSFISGEDLKVELEALSNIGQVTIVQSKSLIGYEWDIKFTSCALKNGLVVCNDGNLLPLVASSVNLQGCGGPSLVVAELATGHGADSSPHLRTGLCSKEEPFVGEYPIHHDIKNLQIGTAYYIQVRLRNSQSYGY
jgi:hypothetical protein